MAMGRILRAILSTALFLFVGVHFASAQPAPTTSAATQSGDPPTTAPPMVPLTVPKGTPLQVALDREVRIRAVGQPIHGRLMQPVYAFDQLVIPAGTEVTGRISKIEPISGKKRFLSGLDADFTPAHKFELEFDDLVLKDGKHIPIHTVVAPGSGQVVQLLSAGDSEKKKTAKDEAAQKIADAKQQAKQEWNDAMQQVKAPGKTHRIERLAIAQLPAHPQYIDAGSLYFAELEDPLNFGSEPLSAKTAMSLGSTPPPGSLVHALLVTPLNSGITPKGAEVEAVLSQPLFDGDKLILPEGSRLKGSVVQVEPARHLHRNGQIRLVFHQLVPPNGATQEVAASFEGVEASAGDHVKLDSEGGAQATSPKTRYLETGISLGLAAISASGDGDADVSNKAAGGGNGFKLIGVGLGIAARSQPFGIAMGAVGASRSVYEHFLSRGQDIDFPRDTAMEIGFGGKISPHERPSDPLKDR
jgi:type IV secretory pathway VirB10-like protein